MLEFTDKQNCKFSGKLVANKILPFEPLHWTRYVINNNIQLPRLIISIPVNSLEI